MITKTPLSIAFPFRIDGTSAIAVESRPEVQTLDRIRDIVMTAYGERVMRLGYGSELMDSVFENFDPHVAGELRNSIINAVAAHEPKVDLQYVAVSAADSDGRVNIDISFATAGPDGDVIEHSATIEVGGAVEDRERFVG